MEVIIQLTSIRLPKVVRFEGGEKGNRRSKRPYRKCRKLFMIKSQIWVFPLVKAQMRGFYALEKSRSSDFGKTAKYYSALSVTFPEGGRFSIFTHEREGRYLCYWYLENYKQRTKM